MARRPRSDKADRVEAIFADFDLLPIKDARFVVRAIRIALAVKERNQALAEAPQIQISLGSLDAQAFHDFAKTLAPILPETKAAPESSHDGIVEDSNIQAGAVQVEPFTEEEKENHDGE